MDGILSIHGSTQRAHRGYVLIEVLAQLGMDALAAARRGVLAVIRAHKMASVRREMHAMSDHYLRDIGLARNEIDCIFR